jgi:hypothetical protein
VPFNLCSYAAPLKVMLCYAAASQMLGRLLEHSKAAGTLLQLQQQLLSHGLLHQILTVLSLPHQQQHKLGSATGSSDSSSSSQGNVLEVQLAVALLQEVATCPDILSGAVAASGGSKLGPEVGKQAAVAAAAMPDQQQQQQQDHQSLHDQSNKQQQASALSKQLAAAASTTAAAAAAAGPSAAVADAIMATPSFVWKYPAAAAAAFGDMTRLVPGLTSSSSSSSEQAAAAVGLQQLQQPSSLLPNLLWQLQQLLLSPAHQLPSLQQQVLQVVSDVAAHKQPALLQCMVQQGWVQVLWSFLPGGRQLLAITLSQLIQQQQQQVVSSQAPAGAAVTQQQVQPQMQSLKSPSSIHTNVGSRGSSLQPHLLQLLDDSLPSLEHTQHALQALAHLCSLPAAVAVAVQLQASYQAASLSGMLAMRAAGTQTGTPTAAAASQGAAAAVAAMLFGTNTASPRAVVGASSKAAVHTALGAQVGSSSQPQSPKVYVPNTPLSSSSGSSSMEISFVSVTGSLPASSSLGASSGSLGVSSGGGSAGGGISGSIIRSSSSGLLSRLGMGRSGAQQKAQQTAACSSSSSSKATAAAGSEVAGAALKHAGAAAAAAGGEPVEDPGSPVQMLVTLLGEQWAATAAAEVLAHLAAAGPTTCLPAMLEQGVVSTLAECMAEIQPNRAGAVAALATLLLVQHLGKHYPEQLHAAGIITTVLSMLKFDCGDAAAAAPVRTAALQVLAVLCSEGCSHLDRQLCAAVAQAALLQLVRWLDSDSAGTAAAVAVLTGLLECGAVDAAALAALRDGEQRSELLSRCFTCLQLHGTQQHQVGVDAYAPPDAEEQQQQQQQLVQLTAVRLLRAFVELDGRMVEAFLAADGLAQIVPTLSAAVAAAAANSTATTSSSSSSSATTVERRKQLVLQYELLAVLDSLSLVHRRVLVQAAIVPIIVGVLRQHLPQQQDKEDAACKSNDATGSPAAAAAAASQASAGAASGSPAGPVAVRSLPAAAAGRPVSAAAATPAAAAAAAPAGTAAAAAASSRSMMAGSSSSRQRSKSLTRSSSRAPGAAAGVSACGMPDAELLLRCKVIACQLITVLVSMLHTLAEKWAAYRGCSWVAFGDGSLSCALPQQMCVLHSLRPTFTAFMHLLIA